MTVETRTKFRCAQVKIAGIKKGCRKIRSDFVCAFGVDDAEARKLLLEKVTLAVLGYRIVQKFSHVTCQDVTRIESDGYTIEEFAVFCESTKRYPFDFPVWL